MIKTILFDYAGVITPTKNNLDFAKHNHKRFDMSVEELIKKSYMNWDLAATGKMSGEDFWKKISDDLKIDSSELRGLVIRTYPVDNRVIEIIDKLKSRYVIAMFSNQIEDWVEKVINDNNLQCKFDYLINSYIVGVRKPDERIFLGALKITKSEPEETLFIDDSDENIIAAKKLGINTIKFVTFEQFAEDLKKYTNFNLR